MKTSGLFITATLALVFAVRSQTQSQDQNSQLPTPGFHHLHLNSPNPDAAIDFYSKQFPSTFKSTWGGFRALKTGKVFVLFTIVNTPAPTQPQTAIWHFGWHVVDVRKNLATYQQNKVPLLPLYSVSVQWYARQRDAPLVSTRGHLADHIALSVTNLDTWIAKLGNEGVRFLGQETELGDGHQRIEGLGRPYKLADTRAVMIEGPSREAIELVEVK